MRCGVISIFMHFPHSNCGNKHFMCFKSDNGTRRFYWTHVQMGSDQLIIESSRPQGLTGRPQRVVVFYFEPSVVKNPSTESSSE